MPSDIPAEKVELNLRRAREMLLGGRGPGADEDEIAAHTRNRVMVGGMGATRRLELAARQTARARDDVAAIRDANQLSRAELSLAVVELTERLRWRRVAPSAVRALRGRRGSLTGLMLVGAGGLAFVIHARLRRS